MTSTNAHRLVKLVTALGHFHGWACAAPGCTWRPRRPASRHGGVREQFYRHLYDLTPKMAPAPEGVTPRP